MPVFSIVYMFFILSNFGFPGTVNFAGEFLILSGSFGFSKFLTLQSALGMILTLMYSMLLYNQIFFVLFLKLLLDIIQI